MPTRICEYKRACLSVCASMPECMREGTDHMATGPAGKV